MLANNEIDQIYTGIYNGIITPENLPINLYNDISMSFESQLYKGYGSFSSVKYGTSEYLMLEKLYNNIHRFSAAKVFHNITAMQPLMFDGNTKLPLSDFKTKANPVYEIFNDTWRKTEEVTINGMADSARYWQDIEENKDIFPYLVFNAINDDAVRPDHLALDGITRKVDDSIWDWAMPLLGYNCRCIVEQLTKSEAKETPKENIPDKNKEVPKLFQNNPGKTGYIFFEEGSKQHPYFKVSKQYEELKTNNFNITIPQHP